MEEPKIEQPVDEKDKDGQKQKPVENANKNQVPSQFPNEEELDKIVNGPIASW